MSYDIIRNFSNAVDKAAVFLCPKPESFSDRSSFMEATFSFLGEDYYIRYTGSRGYMRVYLSQDLREEHVVLDFPSGSWKQVKSMKVPEGAKLHPAAMTWDYGLLGLRKQRVALKTHGFNNPPTVLPGPVISYSSHSSCWREMVKRKLLDVEKDNGRTLEKPVLTSMKVTTMQGDMAWTGRALGWEGVVSAMMALAPINNKPPFYALDITWDMDGESEYTNGWNIRCNGFFHFDSAGKVVAVNGVPCGPKDLDPQDILSHYKDDLPEGHHVYTVTSAHEGYIRNGDPANFHFSSPRYTGAHEENVYTDEY